MLNSPCLRNENCCSCGCEDCFLLLPIIGHEEVLLVVVQPRKTESPREKTDCTLTPSFDILRPTPDGWRKSKTLIESDVQNMPSFPSASEELTLHHCVSKLG